MLRGIRRLAGLAALAAVLVMPPSVSAGSSKGIARVSGLDAALLFQVNSFRVAHGLVPLRVSPSLRAAANVHSTQMARLGYFSHDSANGGPLSRWMGASYSARRYPQRAAGGKPPWAP